MQVKNKKQENEKKRIKERNKKIREERKEKAISRDPSMGCIHTCTCKFSCFNFSHYEPR